MKRIKQRLVLALVLLGAIGLFGYFILPKFLFPSGVWHRREIRDNPLKSPLTVASVENGVLHANQHEFKLAGLDIPKDPVIARQANELLKVATAQGVEVIREIAPGGPYILRCEPRIWHWCGDDPVAAHFEQFNLNDLLIAYGFATVDLTGGSLSDPERKRLEGAQGYAKEMHQGVWGNLEEEEHYPFRGEYGLNIDYALDLNGMIEMYATLPGFSMAPTNAARP